MPKPNRRPALPPTRSTRPSELDPPEIVDPRWILKALGIVLAVAMLCAYITTCALFYRSQWQLAVSPSRTVSATPANAGLAFSAVQFGTDSSGQPQLSGWWIPSGQHDAQTALVLHAGEGSMADAIGTARLLHDASFNVLLFDYRGFGQSGGAHPTEALMQQDTLSALNYLTDARHIPVGQILVYGRGIGASLAVQLCAAHPELKALILEDADGDIDRRLASDPRASLVPAHWLFHENFALAGPLRNLATPKLLITHTSGPTPQAFRDAADPKMTVELPRNAEEAPELAAVQRFLSRNDLDNPTFRLLNHL
jgi:pimeloyl-ACP methyl ester carboxylesterase